jgi:hypothetical protein
MLPVALQQQKRLQSVLRHGRTDRRQRSLQLREHALRLARRYGHRGLSRPVTCGDGAPPHGSRRRRRAAALTSAAAASEFFRRRRRGV